MSDPPPHTSLPLLSETASSHSVTSHTQPPPSSPTVTSPVHTPDNSTLAASLHAGSETASSHSSQPQSVTPHIPPPPSSLTVTSPVHTPDNSTLAASLHAGSETASSHSSQPQSVTPHTSPPPSSPVSTLNNPTPASFLQTSPHLFISQPSTHAGRNAGVLLQVSRKGKKVTELSNAQKATKKIQQETKRVQEEYFNEQFDIFLEKQFKELSAFAEKHDKKVEHLQKLINTSSHYKKKRAVNLENAKIHAKSLEVNTDRALGDCAKLLELRQLVKDDPALQNLSEETEKLLKDGVLAMREVKKTGARPSNKACSLDYRAEVHELNDRICSLAQRTGASAVAFFSRSNVTDTFEPAWICTPGAENFAKDTLKFDMWEVSRLFEQWCCSRAKMNYNNDTLAAMRKECSAIINGSLQTVSRSSNAVMNYPNYEHQIMQKHQVKLVGFTFHEFISPFSINTVNDLRILRDALRCGSCCWVRMTKGEVARHSADLAAREAGGAIVGKKRKGRSDKGMTRGPQTKKKKVLDDNEQIVPGPSKHRKVSAKASKGKKSKSQFPPSNEFINSEDDDELDE